MAVSAVKSQLQVIAVVSLTDPVTGFATGWSTLKNSLYMAVSAGYGPMLADQREVGPVMGIGVPLFILSIVFWIHKKE